MSDGALPVSAAGFVKQEVVLNPVVHLLQRHSSVLHQADADQVRVVEWGLLVPIVLVEEVVALVFFLAAGTNRRFY